MHLFLWGLSDHSPMVSTWGGKNETCPLHPTLEAEAELEAAWTYLQTCLQGLIWHTELAGLKAKKGTGREAISSGIQLAWCQCWDMKWLVRPASQGGDSVTPLKQNKVSQAFWGRTD